MRNLIIAALVLSPVLLNAQANSPASTQASDLQAKLNQPKFVAAAGPAVHADGTTRVSTGVVAPRLIHTVDIPASDRDVFAISGIDRKVTVSMIVDENGTPNDLKIVQTTDHIEDKNVLSAVSQYRFKPGTVSDQRTAVPVNLEITLHQSR